jgi:hypothetical protein
MSPAPGEAAAPAVSDLDLIGAAADTLAASVERWKTNASTPAAPRATALNTTAGMYESLWS